MFERFTDRARKVMALANQEAMRFNHEYIGTEHILLGLVREGSGLGETVLRNLGVDLPALCAEIEKLVKSGPDMAATGKLPVTPRAKRVFEYAVEECRADNRGFVRPGHNFVGTEHILLGLLREDEGIAAQVLKNLGLDLAAVRSETLRLLSGERQESLPVCACAGPGGETPGQTSYRDLPVWQKADALAQEIYAVTGTFPKEGIPGIAWRLRMVALALPPRIAEACDRRTPGESRWFLNAALGSLRELRYLLDFSRKLNHLKDRDYQVLDAVADEVGGLLRELHSSLE